MEVFDFLQKINEVGHPVSIEQNYMGEVSKGRYELLCYLETQEFAIFICKEDYPVQYETYDNASIFISTHLHQTEVGGKSFSIEGDYLVVRFEKPKLKLKHTIKKAKAGDYEEKREHTRFFIENIQKSESTVINLSDKKQYHCFLIDLSRGGALFSFQYDDHFQLKVGDEVVFHNIAKLILEDFTGKVVHMRESDDDPDLMLVSFRFETPLNMTRTLDIVRRCK